MNWGAVLASGSTGVIAVVILVWWGHRFRDLWSVVEDVADIQRDALREQIKDLHRVNQLRFRQDINERRLDGVHMRLDFVEKQNENTATALNEQWNREVRRRRRAMRGRQFNRR